MSQNPVVHVCPYLGLPNDRASHYVEPAEAHRCFSPRKPGDVALDYQATVCFSSEYSTCKRFVPLPVAAPDVPSTQDSTEDAETLAVESTDLERAAGRPFIGNPIEAILWVIAILLAVLAIYSAWPILSPQTKTSARVVLPTATQVVPATQTATLTPTWTATPSSTATVSILPTLAPLVVPTPPKDGTLLTLSPDSHVTGWIGSKELAPHWADRNLHTGSFQNQIFTSVLQFRLDNSLPPGSKILFAALELTGRSAAHLGKEGQWQLELLDGGQTQDWVEASTDEVSQATALSTIGRDLAAGELAVGHTNRFDFDDKQRSLLEQQLKYGRLTFRLNGPTGNDDDLFSWDAGSATGGTVTGPTLYLVAIPAPFIVVTNTPTPENVLTAAAYSVRQTVFAKLHGTPTPFGPGVVTATPGGGEIRVPVAATPANLATAQALSIYATAVALTTGTFTPTPPNVVIIYPTATPAFISIDRLIPPPTPTLSAYRNYFATPIPNYLRGKILFISNRLGPDFQTLPMVMNLDGSLAGVLSGGDYYQAASAREPFAPDQRRQSTYTIDSSGIQQIAIKDPQFSSLAQLTTLSRGIAYDVVWSPDGTALAYVSTETGGDELYVYDLGAKVSRRLTDSGQLLPWNKHPSWSPDSQKLVFWSSRSGHPQLWLINRDGTNLINLSNSTSDDSSPIWVK